ncbi:hydroxyacylglutathione hydrolase [Nitratireductor pacificus]|uniref:Hydroxyacylglutathione hydrolase n=1 Tax=Nitratireductor pacificus pht-3B TaxID=391937 RepID=K2M6L5_9HYPH|nr:hydroxyacylglutathione hydrolase [Nitratireductor pacificus]EKF17811.1 hydroxyacylglutathione hydrolase [Nitratireductor pacificus pht-3B]
MPLEIEQFMCRSDNFGILVHDSETGETALIDAPEERAILKAVERTGWRPDMILTTHHHPDHVEANLALKERFGLTITGPATEAERIPGIDRQVREGDTVRVGAHEAIVIETPGHTAGHISYHFAGAGIAFTADTLFALGCGRLFECKPPVMLASLQKLAALPLDTVIYCGHEYTEANARFALSIDPTNSALKERAAEIGRLRAEGRPTLPTTLAVEMATNPFLRWHDPVIRRNLGMEDAPDEAVFAEIRKRKDLS